MDIRLFQLANVELPEEFTYNGAPLAPDPGFKSTRHSDQLFYSDEQTELNILLRSLCATGDMPARVVKSESPDFTIELSGGVQIGVEVTMGVDREEAKDDNIVTDLGYGLSNWAYNDPQIEARTTGLNIGFFMPHSPKRKDEGAVMDELRRYLREEDFSRHLGADIESIDPSYCLLHKLGVTTYCVDSAATCIQVTRGAMSIEAPHLSERLIYDALNRKREKAVGWPRQRLWLIVALTGHYYATDYTVRGFRPALIDISPFERLYVAAGNVVMRLVP